MPDRPGPLPPLQNLRAFEAAARLESFTAAARELCLTQGAVSRQIRTLEERLRVSLFDRGDRGVRLTAAGRRYYDVVADALGAVARATADLVADGDDTTVTVGTTSAIASLWLMPRLTGFRLRAADLDIRVLASDRDFERNSDEVDLVIEYARDPQQGEGVWRLFDEEIFPVCSPDYLGGRATPERADQLPLETLLVLDDDHPDWMGWTEWLRRAGVEAGPLRHPIRINSYPTLLQAAAAGEGIALGWRHLVDEFLAAGTLVPLLPEAMTAPGAFYLRTTRPVADDSPPGRLRDWFLGTHLQGPVAS
ncbi:LysR substrate-binding domain-containing protein [Halofilum ochraceum]|uniref:LysR substrate-binding domain-containing protein n=1 Tax=Halofilum ochraceum TaxID=1611323 RepID=UPI0009F41337|nr:LysR substrate-binding domain-containing protein [Halofilum ochraceum]